MSGDNDGPLDLDVQSSVDAISSALDSMEDRLAPLLSTPLNEFRSSMTPIECAKFDLGVAYSLNSLFWMYLCTQGISPHDHPVKSELGRIKDCIVRVQKIESDATTAGDTTTSNANKSLNKAAAKRFISAALAGDPISSPNMTSADQQKNSDQQSAKRKAHDNNVDTEPNRDKQHKKSKKSKKKSSKKLTK